MELQLYSNNIDDYLKSSSIINYENNLIRDLAEQLRKDNLNNLDLVKATFEYVRDKIDHSIDIMGKIVILKASEVLKHKEGYCYAKAHLLAALLRCNGIPAGFCYQKLILCDESAPYLVLHGLNGVYISTFNRWIRLDARGNKSDVNAQFKLFKERLAFPIRSELGEEDIPVIYDEPDKNIIDSLNKYDKVEELLNDLPTTIFNENIVVG